MPVPSTLRLSRWCVEACPQHQSLYRLRAVVVHKGFGSMFGHYVAYVHTEMAECASPQVGGGAVNENHSEGMGGRSRCCDGNAGTADALSRADWIQFDDGVLSRVPESSMRALLTPDHQSTVTPYLLFYEAE